MHTPIEIIDRHNRHLYEDVLADMWAMRYRVSRQYNWSVPYKIRGEDKDDFDTEETIYLVLLNGARKVVGCSRLNDTSRPHLIDTVFPQYCDEDAIPRRPTVWEFSRLFADKTRTDLKGVVKTCYLLMSATAEFVLANDLEGVTWYTSMPNYSAALACWQRTRPIGKPALHEPDKVIYVPAYSPIDEEGLHLIKKRARHDGLASSYLTADGRRLPGDVVRLVPSQREGGVPHAA